MDPVTITANTYNLIASDYSTKYFDYYKVNIKHINHFLQYLSVGSTILDVGCASGGIAAYIINKGHKIVGIDVSESMIAIAKRNAPQGNFQVMDMRNLRFKENYFDAIVADYSLIHIPKRDIVSTLRGFNTIVKTNGVVLISVYEGKGEKYIDEPFKPGEKVFWDFFTNDEFKQYIRESGFTILYEKKQRTQTVGEDFLQSELIYLIQKHRR